MTVNVGAIAPRRPVHHFRRSTAFGEKIYNSPMPYAPTSRNAAFHSREFRLRQRRATLNRCGRRVTAARWSSTLPKRLVVLYPSGTTLCDRLFPSMMTETGIYAKILADCEVGSDAAPYRCKRCTSAHHKFGGRPCIR